jgi:oxaloacetate decarboxylase alpha subunit
MRLEDMLPVADKLNKVGYFSVEAWGGATFDSCLRFLNEDPWERARRLKEAMPDTKLQMLLRGQNVLGYRHYPDDIVEKFVEVAANNGIEIFRIFDALNDLRNLETAIRATKKLGKHAEGCISYTVSPVHSIDLYVKLCQKLEELGCDTICIKDMSGLLTPSAASELITELKKVIKVPIHLHCHCTSGMAPITYLKGIEAGADIIDTAISALSNGTSQPSTEAMVAILRDTPYDTGLDLELLSKINDHFQKVRPKYKEFETKRSGVDVKILISQIPGGMMSNLEKQLRDQNALDKLPEVMEEVPRVREDMGYPPLVTPTSQIVGTQAVFNVLLGERYKILTNETREYLKGCYGMPPGEINPDLLRLALAGEERISCRPADLLEPELDKLKEELGDRARSIEDVLSYALFPQVALKFFEERDKPKKVVSLPKEVKPADTPPPPAEKPSSGPKEEWVREKFRVYVGGKAYDVEVEGLGSGSGELIQRAPVVKERKEEPVVPPPASTKAAEVNGQEVKAPLPGNILKINCRAGDQVKNGDTLILMEIMKMETAIKAPVAGEVKQINVRVGEKVDSGHVLAVILAA